jgi:Universal stress protein family
VSGAGRQLPTFGGGCQCCKNAIYFAVIRQWRIADTAGRSVCVIGQGHDWGAALNDIEWHDGDPLLIGTSESGPVARVFLGSRAAKIIRHTPVPVLVVPRGAAESHRH